MKNPKKFIFIAMIVAAIGALAYFTYPIIHDRYFSKADPAGSGQKNAPIQFFDSSKPLDPSTETSTPESDNPTTPGEENSAPPVISSSGEVSPKNIKASITGQHCKDDCKAFANDLVLFAYCEQVCGITPIQSDSGSCDSKKDLEKDYCQKDLAITKTDAALCESIKDDNLRKTCKNRVAEDLLEKVQAGGAQ